MSFNEKLVRIRHLIEQLGYPGPFIGESQETWPQKLIDILEYAIKLREFTKDKL